MTDVKLQLEELTRGSAGVDTDDIIRMIGGGGGEEERRTGVLSVQRGPWHDRNTP